MRVTLAQEQKEKEKSADQIAKELANPTGSLARLSNNIQYTTYKGDLPGTGNQDSWLYSFQPVLPLPVGNTGNRVIFRPLIPVPLSQPVFKSDTQCFDTVGPDLGDITFDVVYA